MSRRLVLVAAGWALVTANALSLAVFAVSGADEPSAPPGAAVVTSGTFYAAEGTRLRVEGGQLVREGPGGEFGWSTTDPLFLRIHVGLVAVLIAVCGALLVRRPRIEGETGPAEPSAAADRGLM